MCFKKVYMIRPCVCDTFKQEMYIVCTCYISPELTTPKFCLNVKNATQDINENYVDTTYVISSLIKNSPPLLFATKVTGYITKLIQQCINTYILYTNFKHTSIKTGIILKGNINKCVAWCEKYRQISNIDNTGTGVEKANNEIFGKNFVDVDVSTTDLDLGTIQNSLFS